MTDLLPCSVYGASHCYRLAPGMQVVRGLFDGVIAAVTLPGLFLVILTIAAAVINAREVRRRNPVRRFTGQQRREGMARAGGQCEMEAGFQRSRPAEPSNGRRTFRRQRGVLPASGCVTPALEASMTAPRFPVSSLARISSVAPPGYPLAWRPTRTSRNSRPLVVPRYDARPSPLSTVREEKGRD